MTGHGRGWESMFWLVFQRSSNAIALIDQERRFVDVNAAALELLAQTRGSIIGRRTTDLMRADERQQATRRWHEFVRGGEYSGEQTFVRPDSSEVLVHFAGRMTDVDGRSLAVFVVDASVPRTMPAVGEQVADVTPREREVVRLIALGQTTADIARELDISQETVRSHVRNAMRKLGVNTRAQLVAMCLALDAGLHAKPPP